MVNFYRSEATINQYITDDKCAYSSVRLSLIYSFHSDFLQSLIWRKIIPLVQWGHVTHDQE
jgi:hypothetical protein